MNDTDHYPVWRDRASVLPQHALPQHGLSRLVHHATRSQSPRFKNALIRWFIRRYRVDMSEAQTPDPLQYPSFNAFFTRALKPGARPLAGGAETCMSPVDGRVSQLGTIAGGRIFQAKDRDFSTLELFGGNARLAERFAGGAFATLYLAPRDYHRVHMPLAGTLESMIYIPGRLFSVNPATTRAVPRLFARNERVAMFFASPAGPMAIVMVGAMLVGSIETVWAGETTSPRGRSIREWRYGEGGEPPVTLERGAELGRFNMGSTVIVLFAENAIRWEPALAADSRILMGQRLGVISARQ
ncbi:MAG TPA: archaetidylserine decarboxylase [Gammaproteobacteria bacterium]|nr:archaetidylserine decarboxylase [Gammaproteobacteria bacterium]